MCAVTAAAYYGWDLHSEWRVKQIYNGLQNNPQAVYNALVQAAFPYDRVMRGTAEEYRAAYNKFIKSTH